MDVGVVGCGFAGAAAALFLARSGHSVTIYEAVPEPGAVGAGIILQPTGMRVLRELGLLDPVLERGARIDRLLAVREGRRTVVDLRYAHLGPGLFGLGLHRGVLFSILYDAVRRSDAKIELGCFVVDAKRDGAKTFLVDDRQREHGPHDLIVVADGARSELRHLLPAKVREYPWGALWFVARDPERVYRDTLFQVVRSTTQLLGFLPTGVGPDGVPVVSLFWSVDLSAVEAWKAGYVDWRAHLLSEDDRCGFILDQIDGPGALLLSKYHDVVMYPWHAGNVVFIGDAAHATSPQLGQGTNLALCDAMALTAALSEDLPLEGQLWRYARSRRAHVGFYQFASRWLTPIFQSHYRAIAPFRDFFMPLLSKLPFFDTAMVSSMAGIKRGIVRRSLPIRI
jgi:2-polyprenyl-6-methoxyphenol hydroxylase-like FAD-dependent oxidoreductase